MILCRSKLKPTEFREHYLFSIEARKGAGRGIAFFLGFLLLRPISSPQHLYFLTLYSSSFCSPRVYDSILRPDFDRPKSGRVIYLLSFYFPCLPLPPFVLFCFYFTGRIFSCVQWYTVRRISVTHFDHGAALSFSHCAMRTNVCFCCV